VIIGSIDAGGPSHPFATPITGQDIGEVMVEGYEPSFWPRGSIARTQSVSFWVKAWQALGGQSANTSGAMKYLLKQIEELASSRDQQPVYIQWTATADGTALLNASELHDGWYIISDFEPNYARNVVTGMVQCIMTVTEIAPGAPRSVALDYKGGALTTTYSGTATNLLSLPVGSTALEASVTRTAGEGSVPTILSPVASPQPLVLSATIANIFKGGVHVYDTINTGSNAVPSSGGTFVNANWVEVFYSDHNFTGDCVVTNGLQLLLFTAASANLCLAYLWNTATATANWQQYAQVNYQDVAGNIATLRSYKLNRVGPEECSLAAVLSTSGNKNARVNVRLQRGRYEVRSDFMPGVEANTSNLSLSLVVVATPKILYNSTKIADNVLSEANPAVATDYGYGAAFVANTSQPFITGHLYANPPGGFQPYDAGNSATVGLGDSTSLAAGASRAYGWFAIPYGVSGTYSTANLQQEMESATLSGGFVSAADAGSSGGNSAKLPNTTVVGAIAVQTGWRPAVGTYDCWMRIRVTSAASGTNQLQVGFYDITGAAYIGSTTYKPSDLTTGYAWYRVATGITCGNSASQGFRAISVTNTAATDFWLDEMVLVPKTLTVANTGPQDLWSQFAWDRSVRLVRP
jgi:hypothetical protein